MCVELTYKMATDRFHKAARDGLIDVLKEATRKETNARDEEKMTPVMWAAFEGRLDALRLLCGKGGDPDKCDQFGNTALHLASANGHLHCVDFLVKFGVNIYTLDVDKHSAKDLAAINNREDILRYLDVAAVKFEAHDKKKAKALKELAEKNCEKRMREYLKQQEQQEHELCEVRMPGGGGGAGKSTNMLSTLKQKIWSSQSNLNKSTKEVFAAPPTDGKNSGSTSSSSIKFSDLVGAGSSSVASSTLANRSGTVLKQPQCKHSGGAGYEHTADNAFKIGEMEPDGKRTITSLTGLQRDSEVLYVGSFNSTEDAGKRGKISDVFDMEESGRSAAQDTSKLCYGTLSRSYSQPDILSDAYVAEELSEKLVLQRPNGLFDRPTMLGSIAFRRSVTAALSQLQPPTTGPAVDTMSTSTSGTIRNGNGQRAKTRVGNKPRLYLNLSDDTDSDDGDELYSGDDNEEELGTPLQRFLIVWGLEEYLSVFQQQEIDLDTLMLLTESDLKSLGLPLGPFRKLTFAIQERRNALMHPGPMLDSRL